MDDVKVMLRTSKKLRISERTGIFLSEEAGQVALDLPLDFFFKIETSSMKIRSINNIKKLKVAKYEGDWSTYGKFKDAELNLVDHFVRHGDDFSLSGNPFDFAGRQEYVKIGKDLLNSPSGVEKYYDVRHGTLAVYERSTGRFVAGNTDGQIATLLVRPATDIDNFPKRFIRLPNW